VTRVFVKWTHFKDVLTNEKILIENVKIVYSFRAEEAFAALDTVIGQIPA
jgi:hypothetical protein